MPQAQELTISERHRLLAQLANRFDDEPRERVDMRIITAPDATEHSCGSAGCAIGKTGEMFQEYGARLVLSCGERRYGPRTLGYGGETSIEAFEKFYGIDGDSAALICLPHKYGAFGTDNPTPRMVARRIRDVLQQIDPSALLEPGDSPAQAICNRKEAVTACAVDRVGQGKLI